MYESHFGFKTRPFTATPNAECFFPTENTRRAFESVVSCIDRASGAALIVGGSGLGKSLLLQVIGSHFQQGYSVAILESASITSRRELLQSILFELGLPYRGMEEGELRLTLMDYLKPSDHCPNGLLLCVDEAHLLQTKLLEELKMITNLVRDGRPRARLVLAGNATIEERLTDPKLESLNQRIATRAYLQPMSQNECWKYVEAHLARAGRQTQEIIDDNAVEAVHTATNGIPRLINQVCDHSFVLAIAEGQTRITKETINEAWSDIQRLPVQWHVLGAETESQNDHVIEFGSLGSADESEKADSGLETQLENSYEVAFDSNAESESVTQRETDPEIAPEKEQEPEKVEFVFTGPENPFAESFEEEEMVVDSFTQVIGHSPLRPTRPIRVMRNESNSEPSEEVVAEALSEEPQTGELKLEQKFSIPEPSPEDDGLTSELHNNPEHVTRESTASGEIDALESNQVSGVAPPNFEQPNLKSPNFEAAFGLDPVDETSDSQESTPAGSVTGPDISPERASESENGSTQSIADYLAQSSDGITFGVGQGIYSSQFPDDGSDAQTRNAPSEPSSGQFKDEAAGESNDGKAIDEINNSVESIKEAMQSISMDSASSTRLDSPDTPEPTRQDRADDRDMIIVEEESTPSQTIQSVPMEVATPSTAPTAKREDYQKLFDRLRKG